MRKNRKHSYNLVRGGKEEEVVKLPFRKGCQAGGGGSIWRGKKREKKNEIANILPHLNNIERKRRI